MSDWLISAVLLFIYLLSIVVISLIVPLKNTSTEIQVQDKKESKYPITLEIIAKHSTTVPAVVDLLD